MPVKAEGGSNEVCQHCQMWRRGLIEGRDVSGAQAEDTPDSRRIGDGRSPTGSMRVDADEMP